MTTYMEDDLLRSVKALAATRGGKIYEVLDVALRRYLDEQEVAQTPVSPGPRELSLAEALSDRSDSSDGSNWQGLRSPGVPREKAVKLSEGETLSEAVLTERGSRSY